MNQIECVMNALQAGGVLLLQDKNFPSVVSLVTGERLTGSWWSHPRGKDIFTCLCAIGVHSDVLATKLLAGKVTFLHRRLWPAVLAVGQAREPWQLASLPREVRTLWERVEQQGSVIASGTIAKEVELRLLAHSDQVHSDSGRHETRLETWRVWSQRIGCATDLTAAEGRTQLETAVSALGGDIRGLPWHSARRAKERPSANRGVRRS
jgi:hypothetical protein